MAYQACKHAVTMGYLEGGRHVEVLVDGEGHAEVEVVDELVLARAHGAHRVVHRDLVVRLRREHRLVRRVRWLW